MSDTKQTLALITLAQAYAGDVKRNINRKAVALGVLPVKRGEGKNIAFVPEADGMIAETYSDGADVSDAGSDAQDSATLSWARYRAVFHVTGLAMAAARTSSTPQGNVELWKRNIVNASAAVASKINVDIYSGGGTNALVGLETAIDDTGSYLGIDRTSTNTYFRSYVADPGTPTPLTFAQIRGDRAQIYKNSGTRPDIALCSPEVYLKVGGLFDNTRRQVESIDLGRGVIKTLDFGWNVLEVDGMLFIEDKDCTDGTIYYLNSEEVHLEYLPPDQPSLEPGGMIQMVDGFGAVPIGLTYEALAKNGDSNRAMCKTYLNLVVTRPNACGKRLNVLDS